MAGSIKRTLAKVKQEFTRGSGWIGILISFGVITANIKLFEDALIPLIPNGIPYQWLYPLAIVGYVFACYLIGLIDEHWGIWKHENDYTWNVSPYSQAMWDDIKACKEMLKNDR